MKKNMMITAIMIGLFCISLNGFSQTEVEDNLSMLPEQNGAYYLQPLADAFGANLNSGFSYKADIPKVGLNIRIGVKFMGALISETQKTFNSVEEQIAGGTIQADQELPTVFGSEEPVTVTNIQSELFGAWDTGFIPFLVPQVSVGSFMGTEATLRYFDFNIDESIGNIKVLGFGGRHSLSQYIPLCPIDIALGFFTQTFEVGDYLDASATTVGLQVSKGFSVIHIYGGLAYETANIDINYTPEGENIPVVLDMKANNSTRMTLGIAFDLSIFNVNVDYNVGSQNVVSGGIGLGF